MRIVEPKPIATHKEKVEVRSRKRMKLVIFSGFFLLLSVGVLVKNNVSDTHDFVLQQETDAESDANQSVQADSLVEKESSGVARGDEKYQSLWYALSIPDTVVPVVAPDLRNDTEFSRLVTFIAESRGYNLQKVYVGNSLSTYRGVSMVDSVVEPLQALILQAAKEGMELSVSSGYRPLEEQEYIFMSRFNTQIANGASQEDAIKAVLEGAAPPGYSKHHSGYTIDMTCSGLGAEQFIGTICDKWLSENDYGVARQYGFIPSYPSNIDVQGPAPEPWEYNYVGTKVLRDVNLL